MTVQATRPKGYRLDPDGHGDVSAEMLLTSPVRLAGFVRPRLEPELAIALADEVPAGAEPEAAFLAIGGAFLAVGFVDADDAAAGGVLVGERLLELPLEGTLRLYLDGELTAEAPLEELGDPGERLARLAEEVGGLPERTLVFLRADAEPLEARAGTLELVGPRDAALVARIED